MFSLPPKQITLAPFFLCAGYDHLIPLDEVLDAHRQISQNMARELRCTALGGLSITPTSKAIEARLCGTQGGCGSCG